MIDTDKAYLEMKIMNATSSELILVSYEIIFDYLAQAKEDLHQQRSLDFSDRMQRVAGLIHQLFCSLDFSLPIASELGAIYYFCKNQALIAIVKQDEAILTNIQRILTPLYDGFSEIISNQNTPLDQMQGIVAGLTYDRSALNELHVDKSRQVFKA